MVIPAWYWVFVIWAAGSGWTFHHSMVRWMREDDHEKRSLENLSLSFGGPVSLYVIIAVVSLVFWPLFVASRPFALWRRLRHAWRYRYTPCPNPECRYRKRPVARWPDEDRR